MVRAITRSFISPAAILCIAALCAFTGCRTFSDSGTAPAAHQPYAQRDPRALNPNLTDDDLDRMTRLAADVNYADVLTPEDPNAVPPALWRELTQPPSPLASPIQNHAALESKKNYLEARRLLTRQLPDKAIDVLKNALEQDPNSPTLWATLAEGYFSSRQTTPAVEACCRAIALDPDTLINYYWLGMVYWQRGQANLAAAVFHRGLACSAATRDNPLTGVIHMQLAMILQQLDYCTAAIDHYQSAYHSFLKFASYSHNDPIVARWIQQIHVPLLAQAGLYLQLGRLDKSAQAINRAEQLFDGQANLLDTFFNYITTQRISVTLRYNQLHAYCQYLLSFEPQNIERTLDLFYRGCQYLSQDNAYLAAIDQWREPASGPALLDGRQYAFALKLTGQLPQTRQVLQNLPTDQHNSLFYRDLTSIFSGLSQADDMLVAYADWLSAYPEDHDRITTQFQTQFHTLPDRQQRLDNLLDLSNSPCTLNYLLGRYCQGQERHDPAQIFLTRSLQQCPEFTPAYDALFGLFLKTQQYAAIVEYYQKLLEQAPDRAEPFQHFLGQAYLQLNQLDSARDVFQTLVENDPDSIQSYLFLAEILMRQNQMRRAERILLESLTRRPEHEPIYQKLITLYCQWGAWQEDPRFAAAAERRAREMLSRWINLVRKRQTDDKITLAQAAVEIMTALETLHQQRPSCRITAMLVTDFYRALGEHQKALDALEMVLTRFGDDREVLTIAAELCRQLCLWDRAGQLRSRLWQLDGQDPDVLRNALVALRHCGRWPQAITFVNDALEKISPPNYPAVERLLPEIQRLAIVSRQFEWAYTIFQKWHDHLNALPADTSDPADMPAVSLQLKSTLMKSYLWSLIETDRFEDALALMKNEPDRVQEDQYALLRYCAGRMLWLSKIDPALEAYDDFLQRDPEDFNLIIDYTALLKNADRLDAACAVVQDAIRRNRQNSEKLYTGTAQLLNLKCYQAANEWIPLLQSQSDFETRFKMLILDIFILSQNMTAAQELLTKGPTGDNVSLSGLDLGIRLDMAQGNCDKAIDRLNVLKGRVLDEKIDEFKYELNVSCGRIDAAMQHIEARMTNRPDDKNLRLAYSGLLDLAGNADQAIVELDALVAQDPGNPVLLNNLGYSLVKYGRDIDRAEELLHQAMQLDPYASATADSVGWLLYRQGRLDQALPYLISAAAAIDQGDYEVLDHLGDALYRLGRLDQAQRAWRLAAETLDQLVQTGEKKWSPWLQEVHKKLNDLTENRPVKTESFFEE